MLKDVKLGDLFKVYSGDGISVEKLTRYGKYPVYGGNGINGYNNDDNVPSNILIIGRVGEKCGNVNITLKNSWISDNALIVKPIAKYDNNYLRYLLNFINLNNYANKNAQPVISGKIIYDIDVLYEFDFNKQKKIAEILANIDDLIDSLRILIDKKEKIKKQTMSILFNKDNFKSRVKTISLNQAGYTYNGLTGLKSENFLSGNKKYITFLNILNNPIVKESQFEKFNCDNVQKTVKKGDLFFNTSSETPEEVALCSTIDFSVNELYLNSFCFGYRITDPSINNVYLSYFYRCKYGRNIIKYLAQGSTRYNLPKKKFMEYSICVPSDTNEQIEYANILMNMDNEIELLNEKLSKYKKIKDGMMEDLLTGKVRLSYE